MPVYTFDVAHLKNADGHTTMVRPDKYQEHPLVGRGWLDEMCSEVRDTYNQRMFNVSWKLTPDGQRIIDGFHQDIESRYPGDCWYIYDVCGIGRVTLYDIGMDIPRYWADIFGPRAGWPPEPYKLPDGWRPWLNPSATVPTCFIDTQDERYPWVDSMGVAGMGNGPLTPYVSMLYALRRPEPKLIDRLVNAGVLELFRVNLK